jgi:hypothetical protein
MTELVMFICACQAYGFLAEVSQGTREFGQAGNTTPVHVRYIGDKGEEFIAFV